MDFEENYFTNIIDHADFEFINLTLFNLTGSVFEIYSRFHSQYYHIDLIKNVDNIIMAKQVSFKIKKCFIYLAC